MLDNKKVFNISNFGIAGTVIYIVFVVWVRWPFSLQTLRAISINELGDFLAGVFGPLMLLWLILGFMLQRKELSQNTAALQLQADELKKSVEQHKELVEVTKEQVQIDIKSHQLTEMESYRETHPNFSIIGVEMYRSGIPVDNTKEILCYRVKIRNDGSSASNVRVTSDPKIHESIIINNDGSSKVGIDYEQVVQLLAFGEKFRCHSA